MTREEELKYLADYEYNQQALKELEQYRALGTLEQVREALDEKKKSEVTRGGLFVPLTEVQQMLMNIQRQLN